MGAAVIVMVATFFSRIFGFVREMVMGAYFGAGQEMGAYRAAFIIPNIFRDLIADVAISSAFLPVYAEHISKNEKERALRLANSVFNLMTLTLGVITLAGFFMAQYLVPVVAPGFIHDKQASDLTTLLTQVIFIALPFMGISGVIMGILNTHGDFKTPAIAPILFNVFIILSIVLFSKQLGIVSLAVGVVLGSIAPLIYQARFLRQHEFRFMPVIDLKDESLRKVWLLLIPVTISLGASEINITVNMRFASEINAAAVATLGYAIRIWTLPLGLFAIAISTVLFPTFSRHAALGEIDKLREALSFGLRSVFIISFPAMASMMVLGVPIIQLMLERGKFDHEATILTAAPLFYYSISLFTAGALYLVNRTFYAFKETRVPMMVAVFSIIVNYVGNLYFISWVPRWAASLNLPPHLEWLGYPHGGIALATSIVSIVNFVVLTYLLKRKLGRLDGHTILRTTLKAIVGSLAYAATIYLVYSSVAGGQEESFFVNLLALLLAFGAGLIVYFAGLKLLKVSELEEITKLFKERFRKKLENGSEDTGDTEKNNPS